MGGPGLILSQETLVRVAPHVNHCLQHLLTSHEDVELGRCIHQFAGVTCTWSYEVLQSWLLFLDNADVFGQISLCSRWYNVMGNAFF